MPRSDPGGAWNINDPFDKKVVDDWGIPEVIERIQGRNPKKIQRYPLTFETAIYLMAKLAQAGKLPGPQED